MFPSKNIFESNDVNRFFSHSIENDAAHQYSLFQSPQTVNRSSSSADSVSPENYFDIPFQYHHDLNAREIRSRVTPSPNPTTSSFNDLFDSPVFDRSLVFTTSPQRFRSQIYESPRSYYDPGNRRPIGRKILGASQIRKEPSITDLFNDLTPPSSHPKTYELFPKSEERRDFMISPTTQRSMPPRPPSVRPYVQQETYNFRMPECKPQFSQKKICSFCRKNGERPAVYENHFVKEKHGSKYIVTCPILRQHVCQVCRETGDDAHTLTYCPVLRSNNNGRPLVSTTVKLKNTPIKSNGKRRYTGQMTRMNEYHNN